MKRFIPVLIAIIAIGGAIWYGHQPVQNPDPNHTHADFAVWVNGQQLDFSGPEFMSEAYDPNSGQEMRVDPLRKYLHLHDGNGHVIHRHKPGLTLVDFLRSVGVTIRDNGEEGICVKFPQLPAETCEGPRHFFYIYTNDPADGLASFLKDDYEFRDGDKILITNGSATTSEDIEAIRRQWFIVTDEACLYSRTCPWRGDPPTENCIADPTVPCVAP